LIGSVLPQDGFIFPEPVDTGYGRSSTGISVSTIGNNEVHIIARHGSPEHIPPHLVNHRANISALEKSGVDVIISVCSTGALKKNIPVPIISIPGDYIDINSGATFFEKEIAHITPEIDEGVQVKLAEICKDLDLEHRTGDIYIQSRGPRLETKAEVRFLANFADVVGMSLGPEATLCLEMGIPYGALLTVDNYANGLGAGSLDFKEIFTSAKAGWNTIRSIISELPGTQPFWND